MSLLYHGIPILLLRWSRSW